MRNIRLTLEYDGAGYTGWQIQNNRQPSAASRQHKTIQGVIEKTLKKILQEKVKLIVAGRTDAGVHAKAQIANFLTHSMLSTQRLHRALNGLLPEDIAVVKAEEAALGFNSCFDAKSKIYRYTILNRSFRSALSKNKVLFYPYPLDVNLIRRAGRCLIGKRDFGAFCASGSSVKHTVRTVRSISVRRLQKNHALLPEYLLGSSVIIIDIEADGFLYNMVRNIVGTLLDVGRKKTTVAAFKKIILSKNRRLAGQTAPACGLCLLKVKY